MFLENPLPVVVGGIVAAVFAAVVFASRRNAGSLIAIGVIVLATIAGVAIERAVVTPREEVEAAVVAVLDAIEANDLPAVLALVDPAAAVVQADAKTAMPEIDVDKANIEGRLVVELRDRADPLRATAKFRGILLGKSRRGGATIGFRDRVEIDWVKRDGAWLIDNYRVFENGKPIDAVRRSR